MADKPESEVKVEIVPAREKILSIEALREGDAATLAAFIEQPEVKIAEALTGALAMGWKEAVLVGGRLVQATLKKTLFQQTAREINAMRESGKIKEDYAKTKSGFRSFAELLDFIDSEVPDEDRLEAVKAMFLSINRLDASEGGQILEYQLFQISKKLSGSQLLTLRAAYELRNDPGGFSSAHEWQLRISERIGHKSTGLLERDEPLLVSEGLISGRTNSDRSGINKKNARLTDLGIAFCERIVAYEKIKPRPSSG